MALPKYPTCMGDATIPCLWMLPIETEPEKQKPQPTIFIAGLGRLSSGYRRYNPSNNYFPIFYFLLSSSFFASFFLLLSAIYFIPA
jgi:hypothetical protein